MPGSQQLGHPDRHRSRSRKKTAVLLVLGAAACAAAAGFITADLQSLTHKELMRLRVDPRIHKSDHAVQELRVRFRAEIDRLIDELDDQDPYIRKRAAHYLRAYNRDTLEGLRGESVQNGGK